MGNDSPDSNRLPVIQRIILHTVLKDIVNRSTALKLFLIFIQRMTAYIKTEQLSFPFDFSRLGISGKSG